MASISDFDPKTIRDGGNWEVFEVTPHYRRSRLWLAPGQYIQRTEYFADEQMQAENRTLQNETEGTRWSSGTGSEKGGNVPMVRVGRVPLNKYFSEVAPHMKHGDEDFVKWWLERDENQPFRTRKGRL